MVLCSGQGLSLPVSQQLTCTHDDALTNPHYEKNEQFSHFAGRAGLAVGSLSLVVGIATPAHANAVYPLIQSEQSGQSRMEKLQRLQAGVSLERRIQAQQLRASDYYRAQAEEEQFAPAQYNQAQYDSFQSEPVRYERPQYEQPVSSQAPVVEPTNAEPTNAEPINAVPNSYLDDSLSRPADGVYLYGQQPTPNQLETAYFVFESQRGTVTGAFYMPSSSFDCVQGQMRPDHMALTVTDSYSQEVSNYALGLDSASSQVASAGNVAVSSPSISGFYQLPVSERDRSLLATCQAKY